TTFPVTANTVAAIQVPINLFIIKISFKKSRRLFQQSIDFLHVLTCVVAGVKLPKNAGEKFPLLGI
ncbi:hypothetical protein, partial [Treponema sp.]|uniref:hypothetical protein n=1 Tax=Treponema sp. TaxID=166 RepID=UPI00298E2833